MIEVEPIIAIEDMQDETLAAFMGALDDIAANANPTGPTPHNEIAERVLGLFDTASTFYDADMAKNIELVNSLAVRLGEMACAGHSHLEGIMEEVNNRFAPAEDEHASHDHADSDEKAKKKKRKWPQASWWMFATDA